MRIPFSYLITLLRAGTCPPDTPVGGFDWRILVAIIVVFIVSMLLLTGILVLLFFAPKESLPIKVLHLVFYCILEIVQYSYHELHRITQYSREE